MKGRRITTIEVLKAGTCKIFIDQSKYTILSPMQHLSITLLIFFLLPCTVVTAQKRKHHVKENAEPIVWNNVADKDIIWSKMVMREIDLGNDNNALLLEMKDSAGNTISFNQLFYQIAKKHEITGNLVGDAVVVEDSILAILLKEAKPGDSDCITKYIVLEEWVFSREKGKMEVHIQWIGPYLHGYGKPITNKANTKIPCVSASRQPLFAVRYAGIKSLLEQYRVRVDKENKHNTVNGYEYFESRQFSSQITCVDGAQNNDGGLFNKKLDAWEY